MTCGSELEHASILAMAGSPMRPPEGGFASQCYTLQSFAIETCANVRGWENHGVHLGYMSGRYLINAMRARGVVMDHFDC